MIHELTFEGLPIRIAEDEQQFIFVVKIHVDREAPADAVKTVVTTLFRSPVPLFFSQRFCARGELGCFASEPELRISRREDPQPIISLGGIISPNVIYFVSPKPDLRGHRPKPDRSVTQPWLGAPCSPSI